VPDLAALNRVRDKLSVNQIPHYPWIELDNDLGFTAIVTEPLNEERKQILKNYRLYKGGSGSPVILNDKPSTIPPESSKETCHFTVDGGAMQGGLTRQLGSSVTPTLPDAAIAQSEQPILIGGMKQSRASGGSNSRVAQR
jgi:hypothetical protein